MSITLEHNRVVGFGDVVPNGNMARSFVILEALIGQVFLLTMLARLVSLYGKER